MLPLDLGFVYLLNSIAKRHFLYDFLNCFYLQNLLALRAQDRKANKRVNAMINRTKGACKAVLDDAKV